MTTYSVCAGYSKCPHCFFKRILESWGGQHRRQEKKQPSIPETARGITIMLADLITKAPDTLRQEAILNDVLADLPRYVEEIRKGDDPAEGRFH